MNKIAKQSKSFYLFARPSFVEGMARVLDLNGNLQQYNEAVSPSQADKKAIAYDWQAIGDDIRQSINAYEREQ